MYTYNELNAVELSPTKKDYYQVWNELLDVAGKLSERWDPASTNESDPGVVLLKVLTAVADKLSYNIDANTLEAFMPSAAQESSMRKLCDMLGYSMRFYASATTTARITYQGDYFPPSGDIKIDAFTNLKDTDGTVNYITLDSITLNSLQRSKTVSCLEGELISCETNLGNYITLEHLDDNRRFYLPERQVASNVGAIFVAKRGTTAFWSQVDNLNTCLLGLEVFKFGYDSNMGLPYLEFPEDIGSLIGTGLEVRFVRTRGAQGNISVNTLQTLEKPLSWSNQAASAAPTTVGSAEIVEGAEEIPEDWLDVEQYLVTNLTAAKDGKDPETIDEAYWNFQKTIGTFDTLVTCRDYMNKIYRMTQSSLTTTPLVSNVIVSDIRDDINRAYSLCTLTNGGVEYISKAHTHNTALESTKESDEDKIQYFDLMLYPFVATNGLNTQSEYENSFRYSDTTTKTIVSNLQDSQTIAHRFVSPEDSEIICVKIYFQLSARLSTTAKVTTLEAAEVELAAHRALFRDFNMRQVDFGEELPYDQILKTLEGADARIKNVSLDDPKMYVVVCTRDGKEYPITGDHVFTKYEDALKARSFYLDLVLRNVLAGKVSLFNYDTKFPSNFKDTPYPVSFANTQTSASKLIEGQETAIMGTKQTSTRLGFLNKEDASGFVDATIVDDVLTAFVPKKLAYATTKAGVIDLTLGYQQDPEAEDDETKLKGVASVASVLDKIIIKLYECGAAEDCYRIIYTPIWLDNEKTICEGLQAEFLRRDFNGLDTISNLEVEDFIADPVISLPQDKKLPLKLCIIPFNNTSTKKTIDKATFEIIVNDQKLLVDDDKELNQQLLDRSFFDFEWKASEEEITAPTGFNTLALTGDAADFAINGPKTFIQVEPEVDEGAEDSESEDNTSALNNTLEISSAEDLKDILPTDEEMFFIVKPYWKGITLPEAQVDLETLQLDLPTGSLDLMLKTPDSGEGEDTPSTWQIATTSLIHDGGVQDTNNIYKFALTTAGGSLARELDAKLQVILPVEEDSYKYMASGPEAQTNDPYYKDALLQTDNKASNLNFDVIFKLPETDNTVTCPVSLTTEKLGEWAVAQGKLIADNYIDTENKHILSSKLLFNKVSDLALRKAVGNTVELSMKLLLTYELTRQDATYRTEFVLTLPTIAVDLQLLAPVTTGEGSGLKFSFKKDDGTVRGAFDFNNLISLDTASGVSCELTLENDNAQLESHISIPNNFFNKEDYFAKAYQLKLVKETIPYAEDTATKLNLYYRGLSKADDLAGIVPTAEFISIDTTPLKIDCGTNGLDKLLVQAYLPESMGDTWPTISEEVDGEPIDRPVSALQFKITEAKVDKPITFSTFLSKGAPYVTINSPEPLTALPDDLSSISLANSTDLLGDSTSADAAGLPTPTKITSAFPIDTRYISATDPLKLSTNEVIQFRAPSLKTVATYPAYVNYYAHLNPRVNPYAGRNGEQPASPATMYTLVEFFEGGPTGYTETENGWNRAYSWESKIQSLPDPGRFMTAQFTTGSNITSQSPAESLANSQYQRAIKKCGAVFTKEGNKYKLFSPEKGDCIESGVTYYGFTLTSANFVEFNQWLLGTRGNAVKYYADITEAVNGQPTELRREKAIQGMYTKSRANTSREPGYLIDSARCKYTLVNSFPTGVNIHDLYIPRLWLKDTDSHSKNGLGYNISLRGIPADTEYQLQADEYILFSYSSSEGREDGTAVVKNVAYTTGTIIKANFELIDSEEQSTLSAYNKTSNFGPWTLPGPAKTVITSADVGGAIKGMYTLGATDQIELREKIEVSLNGEVTNLYWELKDPILSAGYEEFPVSADKPYILQPGEYLYYTDAAKESMAYYGSGTQIEVGENTPTIKRLASANKISAEAINELGLVSAIPWTEVTLSGEKAAITIKEYQYLTLIEGDSLESITFVDSNEVLISTEPKAVVSASYITGGLSGELPQLAINNGNWEVFSKLDISMSSTRPQVLTVHQTSTGQEVARDVLCLWGNMANKDGTDREVITQVYTPLVAKGSSNITLDKLQEDAKPAELLLAEAKLKAKNTLGAKKPRAEYDADSYSEYEEDYATIKAEIESALTVEAVEAIDIPTQKADAENKLRLPIIIDPTNEPDVEEATIQDLLDYANAEQVESDNTIFRISATILQVVEADTGTLLVQDPTGTCMLTNALKKIKLPNDNGNDSYENKPYKDLIEKPDELDKVVIDCAASGLTKPEDEEIVYSANAVIVDSESVAEEPTGPDADTDADTDTAPDRSPVTALAYTTGPQGTPSDLVTNAADDLPLDGEWEQNYGRYLVEGTQYYLEDLLFTAETHPYTTQLGQDAVYHSPPHGSIFTLEGEVYMIDLQDDKITNAPVIKKKVVNDSLASISWKAASDVKIAIYDALAKTDDSEEEELVTGRTPATLAIYSSIDLMGATGDVSFLKTAGSGILKPVEFKACKQEDLRLSSGKAFALNSDEIGFTKIDLDKYTDNNIPHLTLNTTIPDNCFGLLTLFFEPQVNSADRVSILPVFTGEASESSRLTIFNHFADNDEEAWWGSYDSLQVNPNGEGKIDGKRYFLRRGLNTIKIPASCALAIYPTINATANLLTSDLKLIPKDQPLNPKLGFDSKGATFKMPYDLATEHIDSTHIANLATECKNLEDQITAKNKQLEGLIAGGTVEAIGQAVRDLRNLNTTLTQKQAELDQDITYALQQDYIPVQLVDDTYYGLFIKPEQVYKRIKILDKDYQFFYTGNISTNYGLDLNIADPSDTLLVAKNWFDSQNINNKFVVSEIDTKHLANYVVVSKFSRS